MDLRFPTITPLNTPLTSRSTAIGKPAGGASTGGADATGSAGFSSELSNALKSVSAAQMKSSSLQREVQLENPAVSLEDTMLAIQKAQIGFQATLHVRNRMVQAYTDIMNMQV
ncbi:flagellar hook-basal body complex protein FliE [Curvibacter sp. HBC61]|uniref:Flagellar hook-basal body complex protein FliE n=1 Tax=Curvibacter cyanobacteriorum TaxID=3026422 RepID=A0ABT5N1B8_9BURK|nr:flagellar hook-basal body complex protein FliE [Curvibacter sp. HBC61]MDD0840104.1 flagellar hook-basal body complex protein FliE [Curvibacter sp. HBC61]